MRPGEVAEIQGRSTTSVEDAIKSGIARLSKTLQNVRSLWLKSQRVLVAAGTPPEYQVDIWITFVGEDWEAAEAPGTKTLEGGFSRPERR